MNDSMAIFSLQLSFHASKALTDVVIRNPETEARDESPNSESEIPFVLEPAEIQQICGGL